MGLSRRPAWLSTMVIILVFLQASLSSDDTSGYTKTRGLPVSHHLETSGYYTSNRAPPEYVVPAIEAMYHRVSQDESGQLRNLYIQYTTCQATLLHRSEEFEEATQIKPGLCYRVCESIDRVDVIWMMTIEGYWTGPGCD